MTMKWNVPNVLTLLRIVLIPVFVLVFYAPYAWSNLVSAAVFGLAAVTDWLDGYLARRLKQASVFGAFLDPVADKLMVAIALVVLVQENPTVLFTIPAAIIVGREIVISALREWMSEIGARTRVAVSVIGKIKTAAQMVAILLLLYEHPLGAFPTHYVGLALIYIAATLTLWSMVAYLRAAWPTLMGDPAAKHGEEA
jgi:CDP-diacylglycerol--glycerol-3-phosphate 3-phosphatidyltransferase